MYYIILIMTTDLINHEMVKNTKFEYLENGIQLFYKPKKFLAVPQMTHF